MKTTTQEMAERIEAEEIIEWVDRFNDAKERAMNELTAQVETKAREMRDDVETVYRTMKARATEETDREAAGDAHLLSLSAANLLRALDDYLVTVNNLLTTD